MESTFSLFYIISSLFGYSSGYEDVTMLKLTDEAMIELTSELIFIEDFPKGDDVDNVNIVSHFSNSDLEFLTNSVFRKLLNGTITPVHKEDIKISYLNHYPWFISDFDVPNVGVFRMTVLQSGLGFITLPDGSKGAFILDLDIYGEVTGKLEVIPELDALQSYYVKSTLIDGVERWVNVEEDGRFTIEQLYKGDSVLFIYPDDHEFYPILIKDFKVDRDVIDVGTLPLFSEAIGYEVEWGERNVDGYIEYYHQSYPKIGKEDERINLEREYQQIFEKKFPTRKLHFDTLDMSDGSESKTLVKWRFAVIEL